MAGILQSIVEQIAARIEAIEVDLPGYAPALVWDRRGLAEPQQNATLAEQPRVFGFSPERRLEPHDLIEPSGDAPSRAKVVFGFSIGYPTSAEEDADEQALDCALLDAWRITRALNGDGSWVTPPAGFTVNAVIATPKVVGPEDEAAANLQEFDLYFDITRDWSQA